MAQNTPNIREQVAEDTLPPSEVAKFQEIQQGDLEAARRTIAQPPETWEVAMRIVNDVRPTPWLLWQIIRSVFGKSQRIGAPDWIVFDLVRPLVLEALKDKTLGRALPEERRKSEVSLQDAVKVLGSDVAAAVCVIHGVCRRISRKLAERTWRPIIDDALLRAHIGYLVGEHLSLFGRGRGMLAGFAGRCGLAVQIASGDGAMAQRALEGLASGTAMRQIGLSVYGCDPLQISAVTLAAAGVSTDAAFGVSTFSLEEKDLEPGTAAYLWLTAFSIIEYLRMGAVEQIDESYWQAFRFKHDEREALKLNVQKLFRRGHGWSWMTRPLVFASTT